MNTSHLQTAVPASDARKVLRMSQRLPIDAEILRRAKVAYVDMTYDGWQGNATIAPVIYRTSYRRGTEPRLPPLVKQRVARLFRELLERRYGGWENGAGARGGIIWFLKSDLLEHWHDVRFVTYRGSCTFNL